MIIFLNGQLIIRPSSYHLYFLKKTGKPALLLAAISILDFQKDEKRLFVTNWFKKGYGRGFLFCIFQKSTLPKNLAKVNALGRKTKSGKSSVFSSQSISPQSISLQSISLQSAVWLEFCFDYGLKAKSYKDRTPVRLKTAD